MYNYWIIRYVPNVARGEFVNIGLLCGQDDEDWSVAFDTSSISLRGDLGSDLRELQPWMHEFSRRVRQQANSFQRGFEQLSTSWVSHLRTRQANSIQFSEARSIDAVSAAAALEVLFPLLVEREHKTHEKSVTKAMIRAEVGNIYRRHGLQSGSDFIVRPRVRVGKQRGAFDFMRLDRSAHSLTSVWAFNVSQVALLEQQVFAASYLLGRLRRDGATIIHDGTVLTTVERNVPVNIIFDPPASEKSSADRIELFEAASEAWEQCEANIQSIDHFRELNRFALSA